jgi:hypothetical protein
MPDTNDAPFLNTALKKAVALYTFGALRVVTDPQPLLCLNIREHVAAAGSGVWRFSK